MSAIFLPNSYKDTLIQACANPDVLRSPAGYTRKATIVAIAAKGMNLGNINVSFNFWSPTTWLPALQGWLLRREVKNLLTQCKQNSISVLFRQIKSFREKGYDQAKIFHTLQSDYRFTLFKPSELALFAYSNISCTNLSLKKLKAKARSQLKGFRESAGFDKLQKKDFPALEAAFATKKFSELTPVEQKLALRLFEVLEEVGDQKETVLALLTRREQALIAAFSRHLASEIPFVRFEGNVENTLGFVRKCLFSNNSRQNTNSFHTMIDEVAASPMSSDTPLLHELVKDFPGDALNVRIYKYDSKGTLKETRLVQNKDVNDLAAGLAKLSATDSGQRKIQALLHQKGRTSITGLDGMQGAMSLATPQPKYSSGNEKFMTEIHDYGTHIVLRYRVFADTKEGYELDSQKICGQNYLSFSYELRPQGGEYVVCGPMIDKPIFSWEGQPKQLPEYENNPEH